jgi:hypothetical protein
MTMTNLQSIGGGVVWMVAAALLLLATFEPVSLSGAASATQVAANAAPATVQAA